MILKRSWVVFSILVLVCLDSPIQGWSDTITLKTGKKIIGTIIGQTEDQSVIVIDSEGNRLVYHFSEVESMEGEVSGIALLPMYGGKPREPADEQFIAAATKQAGSKEIASQQHVEFGWNYLHMRDPDTAMRRFNQAWLLNPQNADVFVGFGSVAIAKRNPHQAIEMLNRALVLNPQHAKAMCLSATARLLT